MSIKIYNGYKFKKTMTLLSLKNFSTCFIEKINIINKDIIPKYFGELCSNYYDSLKMGTITKHKMLDELKDHGVENEDNLFWAILSLLKNPKNNILDFNCNLVFIPIHSSKTLILFYSEIPKHQEVLESFQDISEYYYFNNVDRPPTISYKQWARRKIDWEQALSNSNIPNLNGFTITCLNNVSTYILGQEKKINQSFPSYISRCEIQAKKILFQEIFQKLYHNNPTDTRNIYKETCKYISSEKGILDLNDKIKIVKTILPKNLSLKLLMDKKIK